MTKKQIQFIPGDTAAMRSYAGDCYENLLDGPYQVFQIDSDVVDGMVEACIPPEVRVAIAIDNNEPTWGCHPLISSARTTESMLIAIIEVLDAITTWANAGNTLDYYCDIDDNGRIIRK